MRGPESPGAPWLKLDLTLALGPRALLVQLETASPVLGVVGPSGSGKSTLLRVLAGLERRARGTVWALGEGWQAPGRFVPPWQRRAGWVPQEPTLFPHLSVRENLAFGADDPGSPELVAIARMLELDGLLDRAPRRLSGGEQQRASLGRTLASRPRLLLLDEPFSALDRALRARLAAAVAVWCAARALPVVLVTHDERDLEAFGGADQGFERWAFEDGVLRRG